MSLNLKMSRWDGNRDDHDHRWEMVDEMRCIFFINLPSHDLSHQPWLMIKNRGGDGNNNSSHNLPSSSTNNNKMRSYESKKWDERKRYG